MELVRVNLVMYTRLQDTIHHSGRHVISFLRSQNKGFCVVRKALKSIAPQKHATTQPKGKIGE